MPDGISSAPSIAAPFGLYPQPPSGQGALSDPTRVIDLMGAIMRNEQMRRDLAGRAALGQAYQGAITPDNNFDLPSFIGSIRSNPDAAWMAGEAIPHGLAIAKSQAETIFSQNQAATNLLGSLPKNATDEQIRQVQTSLSRIFKGQNIPLVEMWADYIKGLRGKAREDAITLAQTQSIGARGGAELVEAPPTGSGALAKQPLTQRLFAGGTQAISQPPGEAESQAAAAAGAAELESTGRTTAQYHADLENLRQLNKDIPLAGPTAEWEKKINQVGSRLGIGVTMTRDQLAKAEEFDKIANQVSLNQSRLFHGSDAGLHTVVAANPNIGMSRYGREGVIDMLQGNQDALDRTRQMWLEARKRGAPANSYNQFVNEAAKSIDPRVFQFNRMSRENQQKFLGDMDSADLPEFEAKYQEAIRRGWVKSLKRQKQQAVQ